MPRSREAALDILGLPTFATESDIILRYKVLALNYFPENHCDPEYAEKEFTNITESALKLMYPEKNITDNLPLRAMYSFFYQVFFGSRDNDQEDCDCEGSDISSEDQSTNIGNYIIGEIAASAQAHMLIKEEEREKNKAEKNRAKKKKRKEKKRLEKLANAKISEPQKPQKNEDPNSDEEDIDTNSAFVSVIAKKHKIGEIEAHTSIKTVPQVPKEDSNSMVLRSRQIALRGNEMASTGHFLEAVELFSESIKLDPSDHRFYGNRSYCYDRLSQFEKALKDSEKSISLCPIWPKGYFRKGRALLGLSKYAEAEKCFVEVLRLDNDCDDAVSELRNVKALQIMEMGYSKDIAEQAIAEHGSVAEALNGLLAENAICVHVAEDIFVSDNDDDESEFSQASSSKKSQVPDFQYDIKRDPNNPEGHSSLWVGNVQPEVTEKKLKTMFGKFGDLLSIKVMPEKFCAFINYKSKNSPGKAMQTYQGHELNGYKLVIRFPNLPGEAAPKKPTSVDGTHPKGAVNGDECYYWRTTGCIYAEQCRFKHIKAHKGIDKKKWMAA